MFVIWSLLFGFSHLRWVGGDLADDLLKKRGLIPKPQYHKKPTLLDMGGIPPIQQPPETGGEEPTEEGGEDQGGTSSGSSQSPQQQKPKDGKEGDKGGTGTGSTPKTPGTPGGTGGKPGGGLSDASKLASGNEELAKQKLYDAAVQKLALMGPWGRVAAIVLQAVPFLKKFGKYIIMGFAFIILTIAALVSCSLLERDSGGSAPKTPPNMLDNKIGLIDLRTYGGLDKLKEYTSSTTERQNGILDAMMNMINKENPNVRGTVQKTKILSLLDQYKQKLQKLRDYVNQIQSLQLNIKPEESLIEDDFNKRNELQNNINATYLELADLMTQLKKEFNKCDAIGSQEPNSKGFYHLEDGGPYQKFVSSSANASQEPFYLEAMPYCATIYIANQFQSKTGKKLWVGEGSLADGSAMKDFGSNLGHLDGRAIIYSGPGIAKNSKEIFGVDYSSDLAQWFAQLLYASGTGLVYFNDTNLNNQTTNNLLGDKVPLAASSSGVDNHWSVTFSYPDL